MHCYILLLNSSKIDCKIIFDAINILCIELRSFEWAAYDKKHPFLSHFDTKINIFEIP